MKKVKIFIGTRDKAFSDKLKGLSGNVETVGESVSLKEIKETSNGAEILFLDRIPPMGFNGAKVRGVVVASRYNSKKEVWAAKSGAKGFITKDISRQNLLKAIKGIASGEIWMSRIAIARVFEEYVKMINTSRNSIGVKLSN